MMRNYWVGFVYKKFCQNGFALGPIRVPTPYRTQAADVHAEHLGNESRGGFYE